MKMSDLRAKARSIFGPADAEPMPNQPNGAKALQQRANARPIPTYKVGGVVKKNDGGLLDRPVRGRSVTIPLEDEKKKKRLPNKSPKIVNVDLRQPKTGRAPANAPKPPEMTRGPDITVRGNPPTKPGREEARMEAMRLRDRRSPEANDVLITTRRGQELMEQQKRLERRRQEAMAAQRARADRLLGIPGQKDGGKAGCYKDGGKIQTSSDTARKLAGEMGGMKNGGKPKKSGLAVMIAIGEPKKPVKKAVGGAGKTRKGMVMPVKKAQGGAGKVRKGMMTPEGQITHAMNKLRGK